MPASLAGPTQDQWWNAGAKYFRSGVSRGTTTSSAVFAINTGFARLVTFAEGYDQSLESRTVDMSLGQSQGTFFEFQPLTPNGATARFRVRRNIVSATTFTIQASTLVYKNTRTFATATTGVTVRWMAFGY